MVQHGATAPPILGVDAGEESCDRVSSTATDNPAHGVCQDKGVVVVVVVVVVVAGVVPTVVP